MMGERIDRISDKINRIEKDQPFSPPQKHHVMNTCRRFDTISKIEITLRLGLQLYQLTTNSHPPYNIVHHHYHLDETNNDNYMII